MPSLYMDEDSMEHALVRGLRSRGIDVLTADEAGMIARVDADHLQFAAGLGRALCTFNVGDFWRLHAEYLAEGLDHAGIVLMPQQRYGTGELLRRLLALLAALSAEEMANRAEFVSDWDPLS
jgi:hypothetical protein